MLYFPPSSASLTRVTLTYSAPSPEEYTLVPVDENYHPTLSHVGQFVCFPLGTVPSVGLDKYTGSSPLFQYHME